MKNLTATALERRLSVLEMVYNGKSGHIGGSMGCMDILTVIYDVMMDVDKIKAGDPDRDRFVMSKGHCAEALYAVLADVGLIEREELKTYAERLKIDAWVIWEGFKKNVLEEIIRIAR